MRRHRARNSHRREEEWPTWNHRKCQACPRIEVSWISPVAQKKEDLWRGKTVEDAHPRPCSACRPVRGRPLPNRALRALREGCASRWAWMVDGARDLRWPGIGVVALAVAVA